METVSRCLRAPINNNTIIRVLGLSNVYVGSHATITSTFLVPTVLSVEWVLLWCQDELVNYLPAILPSSGSTTHSLPKNTILC